MSGSKIRETDFISQLKLSESSLRNYKAPRIQVRNATLDIRRVKQ